MHRCSFEPWYSLRITYRLWCCFSQSWLWVCECFVSFGRVKERGKFVFDSSRTLIEALGKLDKIPWFSQSVKLNYDQQKSSGKESCDEERRMRNENRECGTYDTACYWKTLAVNIEMCSFVAKIKFRILFIHEGPAYSCTHIRQLRNTEAWKQLFFLELNISPAVEIHDQLNIHFSQSDRWSLQINLWSKWR